MDSSLLANVSPPSCRSKSETAHNNGISSTNQLASWTIQPDASIASLTLYCRPPARLEPVRTAAYMCIQLPETPTNKHYLFPLTLSPHPTGLTTLGSPSALLTNAYKVTSSQVLRTQLLNKLDTMNGKVSVTLQEQQRYYKRHFTTTLRSIPYF